MPGLPASPQTTGAILLYAGVGDARKKLAFLGTGRTAPRYRVRRGWVPFWNDLGGSVIPFDELFANQEAMISVDLNFIKAETLARVQSVPNFLGPWGILHAGAMGSMMITENFAYPLVMVFPNYVSHPIMRSVGMPPGVRFYHAWLAGPDEHAQGATEARNVNLIFMARSGYVARTGQFLLGDNNVAGVPEAA